MRHSKSLGLTPSEKRKLAKQIAIADPRVTGGDGIRGIVVPPRETAKRLCRLCKCDNLHEFNGLVQCASCGVQQ